MHELALLHQLPRAEERLHGAGDVVGACGLREERELEALPRDDEDLEE